MTELSNEILLKGYGFVDKYAVKRNWEELPPGCCIEDAGCGIAYQTGDWRSERPVIDFDRCVHCFICWVYCPDASILAKDGKILGVDLYHCKGCGVCATECPRKCISMVDEASALREEAVAK